MEHNFRKYDTFACFDSTHLSYIIIIDSGFYSEAPKDFLPDDMCQTTEWTGWSECSTTCGKGYELRTRRFLNRMGRKKCPHVDTTERRNCAGTEATCADRPEAETRVLANPDCAVTSWSDWSPCSVSCGKLSFYLYDRDCQINVVDHGLLIENGRPSDH